MNGKADIEARKADNEAGNFQAKPLPVNAAHSQRVCPIFSLHLQILISERKPI